MDRLMISSGINCKTEVMDILNLIMSHIEITIMLLIYIIGFITLLIKTAKLIYRTTMDDDICESITDEVIDNGQLILNGYAIVMSIIPILIFYASRGTCDPKLFINVIWNGGGGYYIVFIGFTGIYMSSFMRDRFKQISELVGIFNKERGMHDEC